MGIYDRDYLRDERAPRGMTRRTTGIAGWRMWSVTTWLIVICVGVYVIDGFTPRKPVRMTTLIEPEHRQYKDVPLSKFTPGDISPPRRDGRRLQPLYIPDATGRMQRVGWNVYQDMHFLEGFMHFSTLKGFLEFQWWRFIGFQFLHSHQTIFHLLFNMLGLYFFGPIVERYLGSKRFLAFYLLCGIFGALMYMVLNLAGWVVAQRFGVDAIPGLLFNDRSQPLLGASAGVFGVIMAGAYLAPNITVLLFFFIPMRLVTLAYALVIIALFTLITGGNNAGGEAGHLGGAIAGYYLIRRPHHLHGFFDILGRVDPTSHHYRKSPAGKTSDRSEVDRILDKISRDGIHSLSEREKKLLQRASEEGRT